MRSVPDTLQDAYKSYLPKITAMNIPALRNFLKLLMSAARPLELVEVYSFSEFDDPSFLPDNHECDLEVLKKSIQRVLGPLVRFADGTIYFVHTIARDFFFYLQAEPSQSLHRSHGIDSADAHLHAAACCIRYLRHKGISPGLFSPSSSQTGSTSTSPVPSGKSISIDAKDDEFIGDIFNIEDVVFMKDESRIRQDTCENIRLLYRGYDYAALYWTYHWARSEHLADARTIAQAVELLACPQGQPSD